MRISIFKQNKENTDPKSIDDIEKHRKGSIAFSESAEMPSENPFSNQESRFSLNETDPKVQNQYIDMKDYILSDFSNPVL